MAEKRSTNWGMGALVGALLTAPLLALFYFGHGVFGLSYVPAELFKWTIDSPIGEVIVTPAKEIMVDVLLALDLGRVDVVAKDAENLMALLGGLLTGVVVGVLVFVIMRSSRMMQQNDVFRDAMPGMGFGALLGVVAVLMAVENANPNVTASPSFNALWIFAAFTVWGALLSHSYHRLPAASSEAQSALAAGTAAETAAAETAAVAASETAPAGTAAVSASTLDRRQFLIRLGGATATLTLAGGVLGRLAESTGEATQVFISESLASSLPPEVIAQLPPVTYTEGTLSSLMEAPGTRPEYTPLADHYRIDISVGGAPNIDGETYRLPITGLVEEPLELSIQQIREEFEPVEQIVTMACISNRVGGSLISTTRWTGARLSAVLDHAKPLADAGYLRIDAADNFFEWVSLEQIRADPRIMLCYDWDGQPLLPKHGFPLRIYLPDIYGMKQPKWITRFALEEEWGEGYWVRRGWDEVARMRATAVIDTVATHAVYYGESGAAFVPIGGIAHVGARGVSRVQVQIDDGEWQDAQIRTPLADTTWAIWRYDWPFAEGNHSFSVRCFEYDGTPQIVERQGSRPSGATGLHSESAILRTSDLPTEEET